MYLSHLIDYSWTHMILITQWFEQNAAHDVQVQVHGHLISHCQLFHLSQGSVAHQELFFKRLITLSCKCHELTPETQGLAL